MAAVHNRGSFPQLTQKDVRQVFFNEYEEYSAEFTEVFYREPVDGRYERYARAYGLGAVPQKDESGVPEKRMIAASPIIDFEFPTYAFELVVTEEMMEDDRTGIIARDLAPEMARAVNFTYEILSWPVLENGFSASAGQLGTDGKTLFAGDHPIGETGGTQSNQISAALSTTSMQAVLTDYKKQRDDANKPVLIRPAMLVIPPDLEWKAKELLLSELDPDTANNSVNTLRGEGIRYMVYHFGNSSTNWFVLSRPRRGLLMSMDRASMGMKDYIENGTGNQVYRVRFRYEAGHVDWRGTYGSSGQ